MDYDSNGNRISETEPQSLPERYVDPNQAAGERMNSAERALNGPALCPGVCYNEELRECDEEIKKLQAENERLRARVADLEGQLLVALGERPPYAGRR